MGVVDPNLSAAIAEALDESKYQTTDEPADAGPLFPVEVPDEKPAAAGDGTESSTDDAETEEAASETEEEQELDIPEFYRAELEGLPKEQAKTILDHLQQQDSYIGKLQERLAKEPAAPDKPEPAPEPIEVTDEALATALGYDPEDQYNQPSAAELTLARTVIDLEDKMEALAANEAVRVVEQSWNESLDELETTYGKLPFERVQVLRYAVEEGIASPFEAYFKLTAPAKKAAEGAVAEARRVAAKKAEAGGVKPRATGGDSPVIDPKTTSLRDATRIAMAEAEKETGASWKNIFRRMKVEE